MCAVAFQPGSPFIPFPNWPPAIRLTNVKPVEFAHQPWTIHAKMLARNHQKPPGLGLQQLAVVFAIWFHLVIFWILHFVAHLLALSLLKESTGSDTNTFCRWVSMKLHGLMQKLERWMRSLLCYPPPNTSGHKSVLAGDLKLADFKQFPANKGLQGFASEL